MNRPLILVACHVTAVALALGLSPCRASAQCGDGVVNATEQCDVLGALHTAGKPSLAAASP